MAQYKVLGGNSGVKIDISRYFRDSVHQLAGTKQKYDQCHQRKRKDEINMIQQTTVKIKTNIQI